VKTAAAGFGERRLGKVETVFFNNRIERPDALNAVEIDDDEIALGDLPPILVPT